LSSPQTTSSADTQTKAGAVPARAPKQERPCSCAGGNGECESCRKKKTEPMLQRAAAGPARAAHAPPSVHRVLDSPGRPLDTPARSFMEPRFGHDFGGVRVHTDPQAAESARAVDAHAYTVGQHIVFDHGKYDPDSGPGQRLLAHELAHTVQQRNVRHAPDILPLRATPEYNHLENEAESMAQSAIHRGTAFTPSAASRPVLSRAERKNTSTTPPKPDAPATASNKRDVAPKDSATGSAPAVPDKRGNSDWQDVKKGQLKEAGVKAWAVQEATNSVIAVWMAEPLVLPAEKGPVIDVWKKRADAGALEAIIEPASGSVKTRAGLKQDRPPAETLQKIWLQKVGWSPGNKNAKWKIVTGTKAKFPKANKATCNVDHILELQFGGDNIPSNMQMLDGDENQYSGRKIFADLKKKAEEIKRAFKDDGIDTKGMKDLLLHYAEAIPGPGDSCRECCQAEQKANDPKLREFDTDEGQSADGKTTGTRYSLKAGSAEAKVIVVDEASKDPIPLEGSKIPENRTASTLISGFVLKEWDRRAKTVKSKLDTSSRFPASLKPDAKKTILLNRLDDGTLKLPPGHENVKFHFDFLSDGVFRELKIEDEYVVGSGTITPSIPFISMPFDVRFDKDKLEVAKPIPKEKLKLPIPGVTIKQAEVLLQLAPEFKPEGDVLFSLDAGKRHLLDGKIKLSGDANGLVAEGDVQVSLPGVDNAAGHMEYRNRQWSGKAEISATQLQSKLKYVKSGSLVVLFTDHGMSADGKVVLDLPGTKGVEAELFYESGSKHWIFKGKGIFKPPGLEETTIYITYDGEHLDGSGHTGFTFHGIHGDISVVYHDEKFSGEGTLSIDKGKAKGSLHVKMREVQGHPLFSGDGSIRYQLTENLAATAGIEINEKQEVRLKGALELPKPIPLFEPKTGEYKFFEIGVSIPIPGASIGPVGVKAHIDGSLSAGYKLGPAELRDTKIEAAFNPLDEKPDAEVTLSSTLYIGGNVHISGRIAGSIMLDALVASAEGGIAITATASLEGHVASQVTLHYAKSRFEADANFELLAGLALTLALDAFVKGKAGIGWFSVEREKDWKLASFTYDTGLQFGMKLKSPLHYASDQPMKLPSFDDIAWTVPRIDPGDMLEKIFSGAGGTEREAG